ncbi:quinone-interacting membrane-bound oxidoreductase complex subunit QmoC [Pseudodesulfovibrio senegalensis]|uniref:Heterodisulfide reductase subunit E n=1 Tax=Pseudodesulfovibrio senegalensis TaxID=1721087 RepID=A0A6N6N5J4_9BACT|nr:quinone-interacting membrane-bound oxidoreductase complex subunit QmoC [Pseudodesulfovibrio senegalensis]KAB1442749.1 heterodisulfide reductase subunit E [Pseudodesulfovibrio senegalensis]
MSNNVRVQPDLKFVKELQSVGGESLKKCYQCATCSVVCPLSPADNPYPRKEMVWAQWGLKDRLVNDIDIWLCHNCGTCSDLCPRGAKPGDLLAALRNMAYRQLAPLGFIGKLMSNFGGVLMLALVPAVIYLTIWIAQAAKFGTAFPLFAAGAEHGAWDVVADGKVIYGGLFPGDYFIDPIFGAAFAFMLVCFYLGVQNLLKGLKEGPKTFDLSGTEKPGMIAAFIDTLKHEVLQHSQFNDCGEDEADKKRAFGHKMVMYAFIILMVVTGIVATGHWFGAWFLEHVLGLDDPFSKFIALLGSTPMPQHSVVKVAANVGAVMLVYGLMQLTRRRQGLDPEKQGSNFYDWYLLYVIWTIALTGIGAEIFRLVNIKYLAYPTYFLHLVAVFMLLAYLPWSKLGHLVYRTVALSYAKTIGRIPMGAAK